MIRRKFLQLLSLAGVTIPVKLATGSILPMGQVTTSWNDQNGWIPTSNQLPETIIQYGPVIRVSKRVLLLHWSGSGYQRKFEYQNKVTDRYSVSTGRLITYQYDDVTIGLADVIPLLDYRKPWWLIDTIQHPKFTDKDRLVLSSAVQLNLSHVKCWRPYFCPEL
jgi:hypothetical protein